MPTQALLLLEREFGTLSDLIAAHAADAPDRPALLQDDERLTYGELDAAIDRVAATLQREGIAPGCTIAVCAVNSIPYALVFLGALRAGVAVAPLAPSSTPQALETMLLDADAQRLFVDAASDAAFPAAEHLPALPRVPLEADALERWLAPRGARPAPVAVSPDAPFNIIYSSGTTGAPKGIVQPHRMRWAHVLRAQPFGYGTDTVTIVSTPLYSNTTLVSFLPTLGLGGAAVLMAKFDAHRFLELSERHRATHAMLVPVQYRRIMALPDFGRFDLSSYRMKFCTSAPFPAELKADVLARWPGGLVEYYGMTEGGGTCILIAHAHPDKLHTVGQPAAGHDIRLIDDAGQEVPAGATGEVVGHSPGMMSGYHNQPDKTREAEWFDPAGKRFIRTGDVGRFDADGFLVLMDRKKDMIISGGFNLYPSDLEAVLARHEAVADCAVVGVASERWGETPVAFVVPRAGVPLDAAALREWANAQLGKTQRLADLRVVESLPRSPIGKVLKRELRDAYPGLPAEAG